MYVTRPLSLLRNSPDLLTLGPNEGPNSGYLVIFDEECEENYIKSLPFPQNKSLSLLYSDGENLYYQDVLFIPVLDESLSSNRYYAICCHGKHTGQASASSKHEDKAKCCCFTYIKDVKPRPFDASDIYQQFEIIHMKHGSFRAKSVALDGNPPHLLRQDWKVNTKKTRPYQVHEASGLDIELRTRLPEFKFSVSKESSEAVVVGKWYCPFVFVKEGKLSLKEQMKLSAFYEVTLEQRWDKIFGSENCGDHEKVVEIDVFVEREEGFVMGRRVVWEERRSENGENWFSANFENAGFELSGKIVERLKWEQERGGWVDGVEKKVRVVRREEFGGSNGWTKFGCYVLVESFVFKRMNKSFVLSFDFKHIHQVRCKWE